MDELFEANIRHLDPLFQAGGTEDDLISEFVRQVAYTRPPECYLSLLPAEVLTQVLHCKIASY